MADAEFSAWLDKHKLLPYLPDLEAEGVDDLTALLSLTDEELQEVAKDWKLGHKRKLPVVVRQERKAREEPGVSTHADQNENRKDSAPALPEGKQYAYFASHKKAHSRFGNASADLARAMKDLLKLGFGLEGYFDVDDLQNVSLAALTKGIQESCSVLLFLNDETLFSEWVRHECDEARRYRVPIIVVVDTDKQTTTSVIDFWMERDYKWLFERQVIAYSTQGRNASHGLIVAAVRRSIEYCKTHDTLTPSQLPEKEIHQAGDSLMDEFKRAILAKYDNAQKAFQALSKNGIVSQSQWKKAVRKLLPEPAQKAVRAQLPNKLDLLQFMAFIGKGQATEKKEKGKHGTDDKSDETNLVALPVEVPQINSYQERELPQRRLKEALLDSSGSSSTAVTAPKSRISSQGMGGVGKTSLTAFVVRSREVRRYFSCICWLSLSQRPDILFLQQRLYRQLNGNDPMPKKAMGSIESQASELVKTAANRTVLVVLDDLWDRNHEKPFSCVHSSLNSEKKLSKLLVTTRIRGVLESGSEITLELLGVQESVALLASVAQLSDQQVPPCCLEICQLCGRLPLCINIVGNLIRTHGADWEEEIPSMLRSGQAYQSFNLQQRVIQSGLDSLAGADAADIITLFNGMAVFAEDQLIPIDVISVLWVSIDPEEHKPLSSMTARQWVSQLLSRSILLGSVHSGVSLHDIIRDYILASLSPEQMKDRQRSFVTTLLSMCAKNAVDHKSTAKLMTFCAMSLPYHIKLGVTLPLSNDTVVSNWLLRTDDTITTIVINSIPDFDDNVHDLAHSLMAAGEFWKAARLFKYLSVENQWNVKSDNIDRRTDWCMHCVKCISMLSSKQKEEIVNGYTAGGNYSEERPDYTEAMIRLSAAVNQHAPRHAKFVAANKQWLTSFLMDESKIANFSVLQRYRIYLTAGLFSMGYTPGNVSLTLEQLANGSRWYIMGCAHASNIANKAAPGYMRWRRLGSSFYCFGSWSAAYHSFAKLNVEATRMLGESGSLLKEFADTYDVSYHKPMILSLHDNYAQNADCITVPLLRLGDPVQAIDTLEKWESVDRFTHVAGTTWVAASYKLWPVMPDERMLGRVVELRGLTMDNLAAVVGALPFPDMSIPGWTYTDPEGRGECFSGQAETLLENTRAMFISRLSSRVQFSQAVEHIPELGSKWMRDRQFESNNIGESLAVLAGRNAADCGNPALAAEHYKGALALHRNPIKLLHAAGLLGVLLSSKTF